MNDKRKYSIYDIAYYKKVESCHMKTKNMATKCSIFICLLCSFKINALSLQKCHCYVHTWKQKSAVKTESNSTSCFLTKNATSTSSVHYIQFYHKDTSHKSVLSASTFTLFTATGGGGGGNVGLFMLLGEGGVLATLPSFSSIRFPSDLVRTWLGFWLLPLVLSTSAVFLPTDEVRTRLLLLLFTSSNLFSTGRWWPKNFSFSAICVSWPRLRLLVVWMFTMLGWCLWILK